jgi:hypothetical protein
MLTTLYFWNVKMKRSTPVPYKSRVLGHHGPTIFLMTLTFLPVILLLILVLSETMNKIISFFFSFIPCVSLSPSLLSSFSPIPFICLTYWHCSSPSSIPFSLKQFPHPSSSIYLSFYLSIIPSFFFWYSSSVTFCFLWVKGTGC